MQRGNIELELELLWTLTNESNLRKIEAKRVEAKLASERVRILYTPELMRKYEQVDEHSREKQLYFHTSSCARPG